nr:MAG TPA: hypothetical protein [Bacteriophage sp.]
MYLLYFPFVDIIITYIMHLYNMQHSQIMHLYFVYNV